MQREPWSPRLRAKREKYRPGPKGQSDITLTINPFKGKKDKDEKRWIKKGGCQNPKASQREKYYVGGGNMILALSWTQRQPFVHFQQAANVSFKGDGIKPARLVTKTLDASRRSPLAGRSSSLTAAASEASAAAVAEAASRSPTSPLCIFFTSSSLPFESRGGDAESGNSRWQMRPWFVRAH